MDLKEASFRARSPDVRQPWEVARATVVAKLLARSAVNSPTILDIGCGDCFVIQQLARAYPDCHFVGVDTALSADMLETLPRTTAIPHLEVYRTLESMPRTSRQANVVLLLDVLEHVAQPAVLLRTISDNPLVTREAIYVITVPAFQPLFCAHDRFLMHYRRYNRRDLTTMVSEAGLSVRRVGYLFTSLLLPRLVSVVLEKGALRSPSEGTGVARWKGYGKLDKLLSRALLADFAVTNTLQQCGLTTPGLTCYAICQK